MTCARAALKFLHAPTYLITTNTHARPLRALDPPPPRRARQHRHSCPCPARCAARRHPRCRSPHQPHCPSRRTDSPRRHPISSLNLGRRRHRDPRQPRPSLLRRPPPVCPITRPHPPCHHTPLTLTHERRGRSTPRLLAVPFTAAATHVPSGSPVPPEDLAAPSSSPLRNVQRRRPPLALRPSRGAEHIRYDTSMPLSPAVSPLTNDIQTPYKAT